MATPAVRILVHDGFCCQHSTNFRQLSSDGFVGFIGIQSGKFTGFFCLMTSRIHTNQNTNIIVLLANFVVLYAVARCRMNASGTAFQRNMIADNHRRKTIIQRMLGLHAFQLIAPEGTNGFIFRNASSLHGCSNQFQCHAIICIANFYQGVFIIRTYTNCQITRNGPSSCSPNYKGNLIQGNAQLGEKSLIIRYGKLYVNRLTRIVFVFNLSFCQSSVTIRAPVYRLQALIHIAAFCHFAKDFYLSCFIFRL